jgi:protein-L-isoaspartate(D-aspartate) O-methyltransferase
MNSRVHGIGMTSDRTRARMVERLRSQGIRDEKVLGAMNAVPRHLFVDEALASRAYEDVALPIGFGQTISTPYIVARMCELAHAGGTLKKVLEIGTGCGYQAAVLAHLADEVYSLERIAALVGRARKTLRELRVNNVLLKHGDGNHGLASAAPFGAIVVSAAVSDRSDAWTEQLTQGGCLIMPFGSGRQQALVKIERTAQGYVETALEQVKFVPLLFGVR